MPLVMSGDGCRPHVPRRQTGFVKEGSPVFSNPDEQGRQKPSCFPNLNQSFPGIKSKHTEIQIGNPKTPFTPGAAPILRLRIRNIVGQVPHFQCKDRFLPKGSEWGVSRQHDAPKVIPETYPRFVVPEIFPADTVFLQPLFLQLGSILSQASGYPSQTSRSSVTLVLRATKPTPLRVACNVFPTGGAIKNFLGNGTAPWWALYARILCRYRFTVPRTWLMDSVWLVHCMPC